MIIALFGLAVFLYKSCSDADATVQRCGIEGGKIGFFFSHSFSLPAMELLDRRCNMTVSFLHLKGRNFLYPIFILIVMIN